MSWRTKHLYSPAGGRRTLCGKTPEMPTNAVFTDDETKVTCKKCRQIIDAVNKAVAPSESEACDLCDRPVGEGPGRCAMIGSRGCKIVQGRLQMRAIRGGDL